MASIVNSHIRFDDRGVAWIDDTNIKVVEIALERVAHGSSPEEMCDQHNGYLTLGQIHAALMHYYDHQSEYDEQIEKQRQAFEQSLAGALDSPGRQRLRAMGKLS